MEQLTRESSIMAMQCKHCLVATDEHSIKITYNSLLRIIIYLYYIIVFITALTLQSKPATMLKAWTKEQKVKQIAVA